MKKSFLFISIILLSPVFINAGTTLSKTVYHITQDMNSFSTFFPLKEGSEHEKEAVRFIKKRFDSLGITYTQYAMNNAETIHSESVIIDAFFPGEKSDEIFFIIPLNSTAGSSKETYSFNIASALMLAQTLQAKKLRNRVHLIFMGAEFGDDDSYPLGTAEFLNAYYPEHSSAFFYCNITGIPEKINVSTAGTGNISPLWLLEKSIQSLQEAHVSYRFRQGQNLIYRLKLNDHPSIIDRYLENGYPTILFTGNNTLSTVTAHYYSFLLHIATDKGWDIPSSLNWDKHYLFINHGRTPFFINEQSYVLFLIILLSIFLLYPFIKGPQFSRYLKSLSRHLWTIPVLFLMTFLFLAVATFALQSILRIRSFNTLWKESPWLFLFFKLTFTSFLFLLSVRLFKFLNFSYKGSFYSAASMLFIILDMLLLSAVDISFTFYLVPVLFSIFLFTIFRSKWGKLFFLLLSTGILIAGTVNMFYSNSFRVIHIFLLSSLYGNLIISANLLPVLLMIYRLRLLFHSRDTERVKKGIRYFDFSLGVLSLSLFVYLSIFNPFSRTNPQPLAIHDTVSLDTRSRFITMTSPAPLGTFTLTEGSHSTRYTTKEREITIPSAFPAQPPVIVLTRTGFLNRTKYALSYYGTICADTIKVKLVSDKRIILFDSNFSYSENNDATEVNFTTGSFPPLNFYLTFTLPRSFNGELFVKGVYTDPADGISIKDHFFSVKSIQYIKKKLLITNSD